MTIDTTNFEHHSTTDLGSLVEAVVNHGVVPVVRLIHQKKAWAIYGHQILLADGEGPQLFESSAQAGEFLVNCGIHSYFVDGQ